jgi:hypothetical protein
MWVLEYILVHPVHEIMMHYFSCLCGTGTKSIKSTSGHITLNLCFCIMCDVWVT